MEESYLKFIEFLREHSQKEIVLVKDFLEKFDVDEDDKSYSRGTIQSYENIVHFIDNFLKKE